MNGGGHVIVGGVPVRFRSLEGRIFIDREVSHSTADRWLGTIEKQDGGWHWKLSPAASGVDLECGGCADEDEAVEQMLHAWLFIRRLVGRA